jgi:DNA polymerase III alpha subunit
LRQGETVRASLSPGSFSCGSGPDRPTAFCSSLSKTTDIANLIVWPSVFERQRRLVLSASMIGCRGKVQREGQVIHVIAEHLTDLSGLLGTVGDREEALPLPHGRGTKRSTAAVLTRAARSGASRETSTSPIFGSRARST